MTIKLERGPENLNVSKNKKEWPAILNDPWANLEKLFPGINVNSEIFALKSWYEQQVDKLPIFNVSQANLTNRDWEASYDAGYTDDKLGKPNSETWIRVREIKRPDGTFFKFIGVKCEKFDRKTGAPMFSWEQPILVCQEVDTSVPLYGKEMIVPVFGLLAVLRDTKGRVLLTVDQEVTSENKNHAIVRLAVQASSGKIAQIREGNLNADKNLVGFLNVYCGGDFEKLLNMAETVLPIAPEDTNRDLKHNLALILPAVDTDSPIHQKLVEDGKRMWVSENQLSAIEVIRLTNSHTAACLELAKRFDSLKNINNL